MVMRRKQRSRKQIRERVLRKKKLKRVTKEVDRLERKVSKKRPKTWKEIRKIDRKKYEYVGFVKKKTLAKRIVKKERQWLNLRYKGLKKLKRQYHIRTIPKKLKGKRVYAIYITK